MSRRKSPAQTEMMADWYRRRPKELASTSLAMSGFSEVNIGKAMELSIDERLESSRSVIREIVRDGSIGGELS